MITALPSLRPLLLAGDDGWDDARSAFNLLLDQHPAAIALPTDADGVAAAVAYAARPGCASRRRRPGHNQGPLGDLENTLLLNVSGLQEVHVDPGALRVRVGAGVKWERVVGRLSAYGLAALHGSSPDVGIAGYSLGGGIGWLSRKFGMQTNAVTALEVVTADGSLVRADAEHHPNLFWALRGGGGNFGVVTAIEFAVQPVDDLYAGAMFFEVERSAEVLRHVERAAAVAARRADVVGVGDPLPADPGRAGVRARPLVRDRDGAPTSAPRRTGRDLLAAAARPGAGARHVRDGPADRARRPGDGPARPAAVPPHASAARRRCPRRRSTS